MATSNSERIRKIQLFKGTVTVCIVYALISIALLAAIYFTEKGQAFVEESKFPFAISFALGMLVIIGVLIYRVYTFKENILGVPTYDDTTCPDFWKLEKTPQTILNNMRVEDRPGREYRCVQSGNMLGKENQTIDKDASDIYIRQLAEIAPTMTEETMQQGVNPNQVKVDCKKLYPTFMSLYDVKTNPDTQNALRCAYASTCSIPWSSVCPSTS